MVTAVVVVARASVAVVKVTVAMERTAVMAGMAIRIRVPKGSARGSRFDPPTILDACGRVNGACMLQVMVAAWRRGSGDAAVSWLWRRPDVG